MIFDVVPSKLYTETYWEVSWKDIQVKLRLYVTLEQVRINQSFQVFAEIVGSAFGGKKSGGPENVVTPKTKEEAVAEFKRMFKPS